MAKLKRVNSTFNEAEIRTIVEMYQSGTSYADIAGAVGATENAVQTWVKTNAEQYNITIRGPGRIAKKQGGDLKESDPKFEYWINLLRGSMRYDRVVKMFTTEDLVYFEQQWAVYHMELDDMSAAEEDMLENLIIYKLRIDHNQKSLREAKDIETELRKSLAGRQLSELDLDDDNDRALNAAIMQNNDFIAALNKDLKELHGNFSSIQKDLNTTRAQRESKRNIGADTFMSLIKQFNDRDARKAIGEYNERMKIATIKKTKELKKPHTFMDGTVEPCFLDGADFKDKKVDTK
jgi:hypothetical protein